jgi:Tol biopolymer transport system component
MKTRLILWSAIVIVTCSFVAFAHPSSTPSGTLAYVRSGNIWIKALPDGAPTQISHGGGADSPKWSASGRWLSYRQNGKLNVTASDGNPQDTHVLDATAVWSPVREELAFADTDGLYVLSFSGNTPQQKLLLSTAKSTSVGAIAWSPDGTRLAIVRHSQLWRVNADGTELQAIWSGERNCSLELRSWSSDARYVVVSINPDCSVSLEADGLPLTFIPVDGGRAVNFPKNVLLHSDSISVSPDHAEILVSAGGGREAWHDKRVTLVDPATGRSTLLTSLGSAAISPSWSPDGNQIAYVAAPQGASSIGGGEPARQALARRRIWVMSADGTQPRQLTPDSTYRDEYPLWSRDGHSIVFVRLDAEDKASIWSVSLNDGTLQELLSEFEADNPVNEVLSKFPIAKPASVWFGYYGYIGWDQFLAWHQE